MMLNYFLEADDDTYIYGDLMFECEFDETNEPIQPFIRREGDKVIKFYRDKRYFVIYENNEIVEIIATMTCWSDDVIIYKIKNNNAYQYDEFYHGRPYKKNEVCNIDFSNIISENNF
jgi:hypothetical protein